MDSSASNSIARRLSEQKERIAEAARRAGRPPESVRLIAVSKKQSTQAIRSAYEAGQRDFGENYVQELVQKAEELHDFGDIRWHLIGHLQSNKARFVARLVECVHTVSSVKLATELGKRVAQRSRTVVDSPVGERGRPRDLPPGSSLPMTVLVEVNVGGEENKSGCHPRDVAQVLAAIDDQPFLTARGLMTVPPTTEDPQDARPYFEQLASLRDLNGGATRLPELSMGMSHDVEEAIAAGATYVRIGTAIFGPRPT
jgi:pyridoxal phosphate enzyme (YggS family)